MSKTNKQCTVVQNDVSLENINNILKEQKEIYASTERDESEDAFSKTLRGSKVYLAKQGFLDKNLDN